MAKISQSKQKMKSLAELIATSRMQNIEKYPEFFKKKIYSDLSFKVRAWDDEGILFTPVVNLFGESSFIHEDKNGYVDVKCTSIYIGFLFYGITFRLGFKYVPVDNFKEEVQYHDDYWEIYDEYVNNFEKDMEYEKEKPVKKQAKKKEIKKDSTKFVNKKNTKSTKPKKNGKV